MLADLDDEMLGSLRHDSATHAWVGHAKVGGVVIYADGGWLATLAADQKVGWSRFSAVSNALANSASDRPVANESGADRGIG